MRRLDELLDEADARVRGELDRNPDVVDKGDSLDVAKLAIEKREWHKLGSGYAVVVDLASSTQLGVGKHAASTAAIYEAATGNAVRILADFQADFVAIQGDGAFALFWGDRRFERAITAGVTIKTFSERHLVPRLEKKWDGLPETGFKIGVASSPLLVKRVGLPRQLEWQEPIWAGKAVNHATKAAQRATRHQLVVTGSVRDRVEKNHYLAASCPCGTGPSTTLWVDVDIERLPEGDPDRPGRRLTSAWCPVHGAEYCQAVLDGKRHREDVSAIVNKMSAAQMADAVRALVARRRDDRRNLRRARTGS